MGPFNNNVLLRSFIGLTIPCVQQLQTTIGMRTARNVRYWARSLRIRLCMTTAGRLLHSAIKISIAKPTERRPGPGRQ